MSKKQIASAFLHSVKIPKMDNGEDAVVVSEQRYYDDGSVEPHLKVIKNPKRSFWVTKPLYRTHNEKKEYEDLDRLDQFVVPNSELNREIYRALNGRYAGGYVNSRELMASPYIYGADVDIQTLIKARYKKTFNESKVVMQPARTGFLDIENSIDEGTEGTITVISITIENKVFTAIHKAFFFKEVGSERVACTLGELDCLSHEILDPLIDQLFITNKKALGSSAHKLPFSFDYYVGDNEVDMVKWIFKQIHDHKPSFMGVWNIKHDIPSILKMLKDKGIDPREVFCAPDLSMDVRVVRYVPDETTTNHFSEKWDWLHTASNTQFYDALQLYSRLRIVKGKESSYALDHILSINGMKGKLHFDGLDGIGDLAGAQWHIQMTRRRFMHYVVYNQADVLLLQIMEWQNTDVQAMRILSDVTPLVKFSKQTRKVCDTLFVDQLEKKRVLGSPGADMTSIHDVGIRKVGGAVLDPNRMDGSGLRALEEYPDHRTQLHGYVNDIDFSGFYPETTQAANICRDTKLSTAVYIHGEHVQKYHDPRRAVEVFFGYLSNPQDNALRIGVEFFDLPGFEQMDQLFRQEVMSMKIE